MFVSIAAPPVTSFRAVVEMVSGESRIFSGESVRLKCSIPDVHRSSWNYLWFRGSEQLPQSGEHLYLWNARVQESGKYYCQGVRDTAVGDIHTMPSLPLEINVDGKILFISIISLEISLIHTPGPLLPLFLLLLLLTTKFWIADLLFCLVTLVCCCFFTVNINIRP